MKTRAPVNDAACEMLARVLLADDDSYPPRPIEPDAASLAAAIKAAIADWFDNRKARR